LLATLVLEDESGFSLVSPLKRSWSPRGHTPTIRTSLSHHQRLNLLGALLVNSDGRKIKLTTRSYQRSLCGEQVVAFLEQFLRVVPGEIVLVWDNHPIHKRQLVQDFIAQHPRLHVYHFPTCAPELNPVEFVWTQVSEYTANFAPHNMIELCTRVWNGVARTRNSTKRLAGCLKGCDLSWK
jgi:transposase